MPKIFICSRCKKEVGEMLKGKIKKDAVIICGECNYKLLLLENNKKEDNSDPFEIFNDFFRAKKK